MTRPTVLVLLIVAAAVASAFIVSHGPQGARDIYEGRSVASWVHEALDHENWASTTNARHVVATRLRSQAVPCLVQELRTWCYPRWYYPLYDWQFRLPAIFRRLPEPKEPRGAISAAAWVVSEMEEAGAPAYGQLARCAQSANLHLWEFLDVMTILIQAGPVAKSALPTLRQMAADKAGSWRVHAALAIYNTESSTKALAEALRYELAKPDHFSHFSREIWWFREDETVQDVLLPLICPIALDPSRSLSERKSIVWHLAEVITTNSLPRLTLEALRDSNCDPELAAEVREALDRIHDPERTKEHYSAAVEY